MRGRIFAAGLMLACGHGGSAGPANTPVATRVVCEGGFDASGYDFHSSFWLNLHNFLYREARVRDVARGAGGRDPDPFGNFAIQLPSARLASDDERAVWERAVEYYRTVVLPTGLRDSSVVRVNNALGLAGLASDVEGLPIEAAWERALETAAPVYKAVWWPVHDAANRAWIEAARPLLDAHLGCIAPTMAELLGGTWPDAPIRVDVSVYASWFGAYSSLAPLHVTLSSTAVGNAGTLALESLVHEAGHALLPPVRSALASQPEQLAHMLLFFTAGELVRARLPGHVPFGERFGTYDRSRTQLRLAERLFAEWRPVLEGRRRPEDALGALAVRGGG